MTEIQPEVIDIGKLGGETPVISLNKDNISSASKPESVYNKPSVNFGPGLELLMNDKIKNSSKEPSADINLGDLNNLEAELNGLTEDISNRAPSKSGLFNTEQEPVSIKLNISSPAPSESGIKENSSAKPPSVGKATAEASKAAEPNKTWDGFTKFNNIPVDPDKQVPAQPKLSPEELIREKFKYLRKLEELEKKGVKLSRKYNMDSPLMEMQGEYEMIVDEKEKSASCKFQGRMLMAAVTGLEFLNNRFDPFDVKLDGWAEQLNENMDDYDEIFSELHDKYKSKAKMAPELKLLFQLGGSAIMVHMTNTMFKSAMPGMDDIMRQNPELMQQFTQAAVNTMGDTHPGFGNFMNEFIPDRPTPQPDVTPGPPPPPMTTQSMRSQRARPPSNRPDIIAANDGISISEKYENLGPKPPERSAKTQRPEMKGPSNISDLLTGLKTKTIDVNAGVSNANKDGSTISIQDLKEMSAAKAPPRSSKRRQKSDKNVVSLEL